MNQTATKNSPEELAEIERHKYFLSERAGHDIGWEAAKQDWESNCADQFRQSMTSPSNIQRSRGMGAFLKRVLSR